MVDPLRLRLRTLAPLACELGLSLACTPPADDEPVRCSELASLQAEGSVRLVRAFEQVELEGGIALRQRPDDDERWYLATQTGQIYTFTASGEPTLFGDISDALVVEGEAGLLGIDFHPDFATNGYVYLSYTTPGPGAFSSRIARFHSPDGGLSLDRASELQIFDLSQPYTNHNGGDLHFGPDGMLYLGLGDGGSKEDPQGHGQDTSTLLGAMIRLDVDSAEPYAIPEDNPFAADPGGGAPEIYAWGLRNPWRFSFDRETGELWLGDVGQYDWEEVDRVRKGGNYGWNLKEGAHCFAADPCDLPELIDPVAEYPNPDDASVVGGYVYRGSEIPELVGTYLYTDFYMGTLWSVVEGAEPTALIDSTGLRAGAFGEGNDGELYLLEYGGGIWKLAPGTEGGAATQPPTSLRATGCVDPEDPSAPPAGALSYTLNVPFWSDGADKRRWLYLPEGASIEVEADGDWALPVGAVAVKTFELDGRPHETRLLVHHEDGRWAGYSYEWNEAGSDAELLSEGKLGVDASGEPWLYPSRADCMACHTRAAGSSLGLETAQLARDGEHGPQLQAFVERGWLDAVPDAEPLPSLALAESEELRARAYLHANCSYCHRPGGSSNTPGDYRWQAEDMGVCGVDPLAGDLGVPGAKIVDPGAPESSVLSLRMHATGEERMPALGSLVIDALGVGYIDAWISALDSCP